MNPTELTPLRDEAPDADARFAEFDVVALLEPWPTVGLDAGVWGTVLNVLGNAEYEVEFTDRDGAPIMMIRVPEDRLELIWADPG
jgi:Domain of unknown function (DUF4926)